MDIKGITIGNLTSRVPIIQGGMGVGISLAGLAAAVANQGGIGTIASIGIFLNEFADGTSFLEACKRGLRKEIRKAREMTKGILAVNAMVAASNYDDLVNVSIEEGIDIIISGAGLPLHLPKYKIEKKSDVKLVPIVSSGRCASVIMKGWDRKYSYTPDAIVVEGPKAGGHLGFSYDELEHIDQYRLEKLVADVIQVAKPYEEKYGRRIPVIAAGGIYTGEDIAKIMEIGAAGVQMGTRFVATHECDADEKFKQKYIDSKEEDIVIIKSPVGMPGRAIRNEFIDQVSNGKRIPVKCPYHCIRTCDFENTPYCIALALINAQKGMLDNGFAFCGANAFRTKAIVSVKELIDELMMELDAALVNASFKTAKASV